MYSYNRTVVIIIKNSKDKMKNLLHVGSKIKTIRENLGLTMEEFGMLLKPPASKGAVSNWENSYNLPNNKRLEQIAELGNTTVEELLNNNAITENIWKKVLSNAMSEKDNILHSIDELSIFNEYSETYKLIEELHSVVLELDEKDNSTNAVQLKRIKAILDIIIDRKDMYYNAYYQKSIYGDFYENIELVTLKNKVENAFNSIRIAINKLDKQ